VIDRTWFFEFLIGIRIALLVGFWLAIATGIVFIPWWFVGLPLLIIWIGCGIGYLIAAISTGKWHPF